MNLNDCTRIAYLLSEHRVPDPIVKAFFTLDNRIESEYELFEYVQDRSDKVLELANQYANEIGGENWCLRKDKKDLYKTCLDRAQKEVHGTEGE